MLERYGLEISTPSQRAADAYVAAVDNLLAAGPAPDLRFDDVLAIDPDFAMAHIGRARTAQIYGDRERAVACVARARELAPATGRREQQAIHALSLVIEGQAEQALRAVKEHLAQFPRDALVLQPATATFGLIGFSGRMTRDEEFAALMRGLAPHYGDDWWFAAMHAFAELECGDVAGAGELVGQALQRHPGNANAAHVQAHVLYESGEPAAGAQYLTAFLQRYPAQGLLRGHLAWHLALFELRDGRPQQAWLAYERDFGAALRGQGPRTPPINVLTDAASWLWRAELAGEPVRTSDWEALAEFARARFPRAGVVFADVHSGLAFARTGDARAHERLAGELRTLGEQRPACAAAADLVEGLRAHAEGDFAAAIELLRRRVRDNLAVGGSQAQRDLVNETLLDACLRLADTQGAREVLAWRPQIRAQSAGARSS